MMKEEALSIQGMSCNHCVMALRKEFTKIPGLEIESVEVGRALIRYDDADVKPSRVKGAVEEAGFILESTTQVK